MTLATLLPNSSAEHVAKTLKTTEAVRHTRSLNELRLFLDRQAVNAVLIDPSMDGEESARQAARLSEKHFSIPFLAYVPVTPIGFSTVARLSTRGFAGVIVHPAPERVMAEALDRASGNRMARCLVGTFEASLRFLSSSVVFAIRDLFERPYRYQSALDIALEAEITPAQLRHEFREANLGTAQRLVIIAKLLRGYGYLRNSNMKVEQICEKLGYPNRRILAEHTRIVFLCSPSTLRANTDLKEVVRCLLEWFYKPSQRRLSADSHLKKPTTHSASSD